jgi:GDP-mannose 6-dehydrogenase
MEAKSHAISVFGLGYVGSVTAACLAQKGHRVIGVDVNPSKVEMVEAGRATVIEAHLNELVATSRKACHLHATVDATAAVLESDVSFVCVGTPSQRNGKLDLSQIENVCQEIGRGLARKNSPHTVVVRSTVLPGTTESVLIPALERSSHKRPAVDFSVAYNPEFIREGTAVADFLNPPFTVLGAQVSEHLNVLREIYDAIPGKIFETSIAAAEMVKYVSNAFHALKVSFANEIGTLAKELGVDTQAVIEIFTSDTKLNISSAYLRPAFAFGGSCLPKDLRAMTYCAKELDLRLPLLESILPSNMEHIERATQTVLRTNKRNVAMLGLSFKDGTDDLRESPQVLLVKRLVGEGCNLRIWDPCVSLGYLVGSNRQFIEQVIPHIGLLLSASLSEVVGSADILIIGTKSLDRSELISLIRPDQLVIDLTNSETSLHSNNGFSYQGLCW